MLGLTLIISTILASTVLPVSCKAVLPRDGHLNSTMDVLSDTNRFRDCDCVPSILLSDQDNDDRNEDESVAPDPDDPNVRRRSIAAGRRQFEIEIFYLDKGPTERLSLDSSPFPDSKDFDREDPIAMAYKHDWNCDSVEIEAFTLAKAGGNYRFQSKLIIVYSTVRGCGSTDLAFS